MMLMVVGHVLGMYEPTSARSDMLTNSDPKRRPQRSNGMNINQGRGNRVFRRYVVEALRLVGPQIMVF